MEFSRRVGDGQGNVKGKGGGQGLGEGGGKSAGKFGGGKGLGEFGGGKGKRAFTNYEGGDDNSSWDCQTTTWRQDCYWQQHWPQQQWEPETEANTFSPFVQGQKSKTGCRHFPLNCERGENDADENDRHNDDVHDDLLTNADDCKSYQNPKASNNYYLAAPS